MFEKSSSSASRRPHIPPSSEDSTDADPEAVTDATGGPAPIVLSTFGRRNTAPTYRWSAVFSILLHVTLIGLTLWLSRKVAFHHAEAVTVLLRAPPPPRPPPPAPPRETEAVRKGSRGVSLPKAVAQDIQPDFELSFAAPVTEETTGTTGKWVGGVGTGIASGPGWADGVEGGAVIRRSRAREPQPLNTGWPCNFPEEEADNRLVVRIRVHVTESGRPTQVTIVRPGPRAFNVSAIECAMNERYHPALDLSGTPCEGDVEVGILFFRTGSRPSEQLARPATPAVPPPPPPMGGPQPDLPVQLDDSPAPEEKPSAGG